MELKQLYIKNQMMIVQLTCQISAVVWMRGLEDKRRGQSETWHIYVQMSVWDIKNRMAIRRIKLRITQNNQSHEEQRWIEDQEMEIYWVYAENEGW